MLKNIKALINRRNEFEESAKLIYETVADEELDDFIMLEADDKKDEDKEEDQVKKETEEVVDEEPENLEDLPLTDESETPEETPSEPEEDLMNTSLTDDGPTQLSDPVPEEGSIETPGSDDLDDLLEITLDLKTNIVTDVLPTPPANAMDAVPSEDMSSIRIDSGFGEESETIETTEESEPVIEEETNETLEEKADVVEKITESTINEDDLMNASLTEEIVEESDSIIESLDEDINLMDIDLNETFIESEEAESVEESKETKEDDFDLFNEAITLDGSAEENKQQASGDLPPDDPAAAINPLPGEEPAADAAAAQPAEPEKSTVTQRVEEQLSDAAAEDPVVTDEPSEGSDDSSGKVEIAKDLTKLTNQISQMQQKVAEMIAK